MNTIHVTTTANTTRSGDAQTPPPGALNLEALAKPARDRPAPHNPALAGRHGQFTPSAFPGYAALPPFPIPSGFAGILDLGSAASLIPDLIGPAQAGPNVPVNPDRAARALAEFSRCGRLGYDLAVKLPHQGVILADCMTGSLAMVQLTDRQRRELFASQQPHPEPSDAPEWDEAFIASHHAWQTDSKPKNRAIHAALEASARVLNRLVPESSVTPKWFHVRLFEYRLH